VAGLGIWLGLRLPNPRAEQSWSGRSVPVGKPPRRFPPNEKKREDLSMTRRELEILELVAQA